MLPVSVPKGQRGAWDIVVNRFEERDFLKEMPVAYAVLRTVVDESGRTCDIVYAYVNEAGARAGGLTCDDLRGKSIRSVFPCADRMMFAALVETANEGVRQYFTHRASGDRYFTIQTYRPEAGFCACVMHDVTELARQESVRKEERQQLEHRATRDPLTGLYNVREGRQLAECLLAAPRLSDAHSALFMFDLDDFKLVNDEHGHDRGDAVLRGFADVLERSFRCSDIVFRVGGDEFSAFVPDIPCACVAERICADVVAGVEAFAETCVDVSVSIGVAVGRPVHSYDAFYRAADQALYGIKRTGKSSYRIADMDDTRVKGMQDPSASRED